MYFKSFPYTYYSLDDASTVQVVTNITARAVLSDEVKNNLSLYDEYDIKDGETPELLADKFYGNPELHWVVLHYNEIIDPRFDWPLDTNNLSRYISGKYNNPNGIHHYEDANLAIANGNVIINANVSYLNVGNVVTNLSGSGTGYVTSKINSSILLAVFIASVGFTFLATLNKPIVNGMFNGKYYQYLSVNVVLASASLFMLLKNTFKASKFYLDKLRFGNKYGFGVYLIHVLVLDALQLIHINGSFINPLVGSVITIVVCYLISLVLVSFLSRIRILADLIN